MLEQFNKEIAKIGDLLDVGADIGVGGSIMQPENPPEILIVDPFDDLRLVGICKPHLQTMGCNVHTAASAAELPKMEEGKKYALCAMVQFPKKTRTNSL